MICGQHPDPVLAERIIMHGIVLPLVGHFPLPKLDNVLPVGLRLLNVKRGLQPDFPPPLLLGALLLGVAVLGGLLVLGALWLYMRRRATKKVIAPLPGPAIPPRVVPTERMDHTPMPGWGQPPSAPGVPPPAPFQSALTERVPVSPKGTTPQVMPVAPPSRSIPTEKMEAPPTSLRPLPPSNTAGNAGPPVLPVAPPARSIPTEKMSTPLTPPRPLPATEGNAPPNTPAPMASLFMPTERMSAATPSGTAGSTPARLAMRLPLPGTRVTLGNGAGSELLVPAPDVAPQHAILALEGGRYTLNDLSGGRTSVSYSGDPQFMRPISRNALKDGSLIRLGQVTLLFRQPAQGTPWLDLSLPVAATGVLIGTHPGNAIVLAHPSVAPQHAELRAQAGGWTVRDLGSPQGTFVSVSGNPDQAQRASEETTLKNGSTVRLGEVAFVFRTD